MSSDLNVDFIIAQKEERKSERREANLWILLALAVSVRPIIFFFERLSVEKSVVLAAAQAFSSSYAPIVSMSILFFAVIFRQIFGKLPISTFHRNIFDQVMRVNPYESNIVEGDIIQSRKIQSVSSIKGEILAKKIKDLDPRELLATYAEQTSLLANRIYSRSGVYLLVGVVISFTGLIFFYFRNKDIVISDNYIDKLLEFMPGFGILFFIEFIAFFFLRQYRSAMDEFRYFDAIQRNREESLVILKMFAESSEVISTKDVLSAMHMYSNAGILHKEETTEILETRKLQKDEFALFEKMLSFISAARASKSEKNKE